MLDILIAALFGLVEGITEWLPISSTGHMILLNDLISMNVSEKFWDMFLVVIQLGAILAVVLLFWNRLFPFGKEKNGSIVVKKDIFSLWGKIIAACLPAAVIGLLFDEYFEALFYNKWTVAIMLILVGILFILLENRNKGKLPTVASTAEITYKAALIIGLFQLVAAIFPGTSRSGATILGGLMIGLSRKTAADFTFFLAVPVMFGASLLKIVKFGFGFTGLELAILLVGMAVAFIVSVLAIKFLLGYIKKHDFKVFGWYRIALGILVLGVGMFQAIGA
ncbi:MAG: undecaprenyl-diphosphate phosphatase [Candidatus Howiella sp.]|jgi:undecaprenyl-diphosphatase